jgi:4-methyl-5(b-hydroxyethyl)-thiazole monophosphate biosynthesis
MSRGIKIEPDIAWDQVNIFDYALMVMPGGIGGKDTLCADERVLEAIRFFASEEDKWLAAVCAAPLVLQEAGVLNGQRITCYPGLSDQVAEAEWVNEPVVSDGHLVTSQGPGTCFLFALRLIELMDGPERAETVASGMLVRP